MGHYPPAARLYLSEVMEFESLGPVTSTVIGKLDRTLIVKDITFENGTSLVSEMIGRKYARICPDISDRLQAKFGTAEFVESQDDSDDEYEVENKISGQATVESDQNHPKTNPKSEDQQNLESEKSEDKYEKDDRMTGQVLDKCTEIADDRSPVKTIKIVPNNSIDTSPTTKSTIQISNDASPSSSFEVITEANTGTSGEIMTQDSLEPITLDSLPIESELETLDDLSQGETFQNAAIDCAKKHIGAQIGLDEETKNLLFKSMEIVSGDLSGENVMSELSRVLQEIFDKIPAHEFDAKVKDPYCDVILTPHLLTVGIVMKIMLPEIQSAIDGEVKSLVVCQHFLAVVLHLCQLCHFSVFFLDDQDRLNFVAIISKLWSRFGYDWTDSQAEEFLKVKVFEDLFLTLQDGFYSEKIAIFGSLEKDLTLFRKVLFTEVIEWQSLRIHVIRCVSEILCQYSHSKPDKTENLEHLASTILIGWIIPVLRFYHRNDFQKMDNIDRVLFRFT